MNKNKNRNKYRLLKKKLNLYEIPNYSLDYLTTKGIKNKNTHLLLQYMINLIKKKGDNIGGNTRKKPNILSILKTKI